MKQYILHCVIIAACQAGGATAMAVPQYPGQDSLIQLGIRFHYPERVPVLPDDVISSFEGNTYTAVITDEEIILSRAYGCRSTARGRYLTTSDAVVDHVSAVQNLFLPPGNCAQWVTAVRLPPGTMIFVGRVSKGQALQCYIEDTSIETIDTPQSLYCLPTQRIRALCRTPEERTAEDNIGATVMNPVSSSHQDSEVVSLTPP